MVFGLAIRSQRRKLSGIKEGSGRVASLLLPFRERGPGRVIEDAGRRPLVEVDDGQTLLNLLLARLVQVQGPFRVGGPDIVFKASALGPVGSLMASACGAAAGVAVLALSMLAILFFAICAKTPLGKALR